MNLLKQKWHTVGQPWGDGGWGIAGNHDPHAGDSGQGLWGGGEMIVKAHFEPKPVEPHSSVVTAVQKHQLIYDIEMSLFHI